jgi:hypothetical protein
MVNGVVLALGARSTLWPSRGQRCIYCWCWYGRQWGGDSGGFIRWVRPVRRPSVCLSMPVWLSVCLCVCPSVCQCLFDFLCVCPSWLSSVHACLFVRLSAYLCVCPMHVWLFVRLSVCLFVCLPVCMSVWLSVVSVFLYVWLSDRYILSCWVVLLGRPLPRVK